MGKGNRVKKTNAGILNKGDKKEGAFDRDVGMDYENLKAKSLDEESINDLYYGNAFFKRLIDEIPSDSLKNGFKIVFNPENENLSNKILSLFEKLELDNYITEFIQKGRKDGFCALLPVVTGLSLKTSEPLNLNKLKKILDFNIIEKKNIVKIKRNQDITKPFYGEIETLDIKNGNGQKIRYHSSQLLIFETGIKCDESILSNKLHLSLYTGLFDALQVNYNIGWSTGQYAFSSFAKVLKIGDSQELEKIKKSGLSKYQKKKELELNSSSFAVIGSADTLESLDLGGNVNFETLQKVSINDIATRLGIPVSKLMGASAGALASAEQDGERYREVVEQFQNVIVKDFLKKILNMIMATENIYDAKYEVVFNSILAKDIKKEAEVNKLEAEKEKIRAEASKIKIETLISLNKDLNDSSITNILKKLGDKLKNSLIEDLELEDEG